MNKKDKIFASKPEEVETLSGAKESILTNKKLTILVVVILLANLALSGVVVGVGINTYGQWGPWFEKNIMGKESSVDGNNNADDGGGQDNGSQQNLSVLLEDRNTETQVIDEQGQVERVVERANPAVVSIIVTKDIPKMEQYYENYDPFGNNEFFRQFFGDSFDFQVPQYRQNGTEKQEIGAGSGFIVRADGLIVTNKHVVSDESAAYTVLTNDGQKYEATVLARDPVNDIALLKINKDGLPVVKLGDSDSLKVGQTVIAIGNALGEYRNTVSKGVVSGLKRDITAGGAIGQAEQLSGVIQTDAAINPGNSGGPLLNLKGEAIGVTVAIVQGSQNIAFSLPINDVRKVIDSVEKYGKILRPWIGVRYVMVNKELKDKNQLPVDYGVLVVRGETNTDLAVVPGSPADKAGIVENDIVLEIDGKKLEGDYTLSKAIANYNVGDKLKVKIYHKGEEKTLEITLEERK